MRSTLEPGAVQHLQRRINAARGRSMQEDLAQPHHVIENGGGAGLVFRAPLLGVAHQILHRELGGLEVGPTRGLQSRDAGLLQRPHSVTFLTALT